MLLGWDGVHREITEFPVLPSTGGITREAGNRLTRNRLVGVMIDQILDHNLTID